MKIQNRETFEGDINEKIEQMESDLARWEGDAGEDMDHDEKLATLKRKREALQAKLNEMQDADDEDWEAHREEVTAQWQDVKNTYDELLETREGKSDARPTSELLKGSSSAAGMMGDDSV